MTPTLSQPISSRAEVWFQQCWKLLLRVAGLCLLLYVLWRTRAILTDILIASILAFALIGPVNFLCRHHVKWISHRAQRLIVTLVVFIGLGILIYQSVAIMIWPFHSEAMHLGQDLPRYEKTILDKVTVAKAWIAGLPPEVRNFFQKQDTGSLTPSLTRWLRGFLEGTYDSLKKIVDVLLIPVLAFYFIIDGHGLRNEFLALLPKQRRREAIVILRESSAIMRTFVIAQFWLCIIAGVVVSIGLSALHMKYALILGILAGVTRAIPIIGPIISGIPIVLLALVLPGGGFLLALKVLTFFSVMHMIESKIIMPKFIGHRIHLHAALVIIVLLIGGEFFGLLGMFMAAPIAAIGRVLINQYLLRPRRLAEKAQRLALQTDNPPLIISTLNS